MKKAILLTALFVITQTLFPQSLIKTKVLVLGTPHLDQIDGLQPEYLDRVLDHLTNMNFDAVAIEKMPAELLLDIMSRKGSHWKDLYNYAGKSIEIGQSFQESLNLSYDEAINLLSELNQKQDLTDSDRLDYIKSFLCSYDPWSAALHYKLLGDKTDLSEEIAGLMEEYSSSNNEINLLGLATAIQAGCRQLYYIDNLQDESILMRDFPYFIEDYQANAAKVGEILNANPIYKEISELEKNAVEREEFFDLYKFYNSETYMEEDFKGQWELWLKTNFKSKGDRARYSLWEMRNLMITANILRTIASNPEKTILVIIGASHKSFIEKYLTQVPDIELLSF